MSFFVCSHLSIISTLCLFSHECPRLFVFYCCYSVCFFSNHYFSFFFFFFFQAEDGIRDGRVTGVQTCALPISWLRARKSPRRSLALDAALAQAAGRSVMLALQMANNETGVLQPITEAVARVHAHGGIVVSDAVQERKRVVWGKRGGCGGGRGGE